MISDQDAMINQETGLVYYKNLQRYVYLILAWQISFGRVLWRQIQL
jgi:hypothetical protein